MVAENEAAHQMWGNLRGAVWPEASRCRMLPQALFARNDPIQMIGATEICRSWQEIGGRLGFKRSDIPSMW